MANQFPPMSPFAIAFADEYRGFMKSKGVTGAQIAVVLDRGEGYVSERVNGKRALDTNDVDALASLVDGWTGLELMRELARRTRETSHVAPVTPIRRNVGTSTEDHEQNAARPAETEPTEEQ